MKPLLHDRRGNRPSRQGRSAAALPSLSLLPDRLLTRRRFRIAGQGSAGCRKRCRAAGLLRLRRRRLSLLRSRLSQPLLFQLLPTFGAAPLDEVLAIGAARPAQAPSELTADEREVGLRRRRRQLTVHAAVRHGCSRAGSASKQASPCARMAEHDDIRSALCICQVESTSVASGTTTSSPRGIEVPYITGSTTPCPTRRYPSRPHPEFRGGVHPALSNVSAPGVFFRGSVRYEEREGRTRGPGPSLNRADFDCAGRCHNLEFHGRRRTPHEMPLKSVVFDYDHADRITRCPQWQLKRPPRVRAPRWQAPPRDGDRQ